MGMTVLRTYVPQHHCEGQKAASDPLELELQMIVSLHMDAGNGTQDFYKGSRCS